MSTPTWTRLAYLEGKYWDKFEQEPPVGEPDDSLVELLFKALGGGQPAAATQEVAAGLRVDVDALSARVDALDSLMTVVQSAISDLETAVAALEGPL